MAVCIGAIFSRILFQVAITRQNFTLSKGEIMGLKLDLQTSSQDLPQGVTALQGYRYSISQGGTVLATADDTAPSHTFTDTFTGSVDVSVQAIDQNGAVFGDAVTASYTVGGSNAGGSTGKYDAPASVAVSEV